MTFDKVTFLLGINAAYAADEHHVDVSITPSEDMSMDMPEFSDDLILAYGINLEIYGDAKSYELDISQDRRIDLSDEEIAIYESVQGGQPLNGVDALFTVEDLEVAFGNDTIYAVHTYGNNLMVGDVGLFDLDVGKKKKIRVDAPEDAAPEDADYFIELGVSDTGTKVTFGGDHIYAGHGRDDIYGDAIRYSETLQNTNNLQGSVEDVEYNILNRIVSQQRMVEFGDNTIYAGSNHDLVAGNVGRFDLNVRSGDIRANANVPDQDNGVTHLENTYIFGDDMIDAGSGNDTVAGDAFRMNLSAKSGDIKTDDPAAEPRIDPLGALAGPRSSSNFDVLTLTTGMDTIYAGDGHDKVYGDAERFNLDLVAAEENNSDISFGSARMILSSFTFESDVLHGGAGDDTLIGAVDRMNLEFKATDNAAAKSESRALIGVFTSDLSFGLILTAKGDEIYGGLGDDRIVGGIRKLSVHAEAGDANQGGAFVQAGWLIPNTIDFEANTLYGNEGNDHITGDIELWSVTALGGDDVLGGSSVDFSPGFNIVDGSRSSAEVATVATADDTIDGGSGHDVLIGDIDKVDAMIIAGKNADPNGVFNPDIFGPGSGISLSVNAFLGVEDFSGAIAPIQYGSDTIHGGDDNDMIIGDGMEVNLHIEAGSINADPMIGGDSVLANATSAAFVAGNDVLNGDAGDDLLLGDWGIINVNLMDGSGVRFDPVNGIFDSASATLNGLLHGDDILNGGAGNDTLVGDTLEINYTRNEVEVAIMDDIPETVTQVVGFDPETGPIFASTETFAWGDDTLTGGDGADEFVFAMYTQAGAMEFQGNDTITDLAAEDTIVLYDVLDLDNDGDLLDDLDAVSTFSLEDADMDGNMDDVVIRLDNPNTGDAAGSLTLLDHDPIASWTDLNVDVVVA